MNAAADGGKLVPTLESIVSLDPEVMSGTPVFAGTRVPVKNLLDYLAAGDPLERFLDHFPSVRRAQAVAAWRSLPIYSGPMRVLLDESLPRPLGRLLVGQAVRTVGQAGWTSFKNGRLLRLAAADFDGLITADQGLEFQQNLHTLPLAVAVLVARQQSLGIPGTARA